MKKRSVNTQDFPELLITILSVYYALTTKRAMRRATWRASFTPAREESPVYAIIFRSFSFFFLIRCAIRRVYLSRCQLGRVGLRNRLVRKNDGAVRPQRVPLVARSRCSLLGGDTAVKKFAGTGKRRGRTRSLGFHVRVKLDNSQRRASHMISDAIVSARTTTTTRTMII